MSVGSTEAAAGTLDTIRGRRIASADRLWGRDVYVIGIGPLPVPPRDDLVAAVRRLGDHRDRTRLGWVPDYESWRWRIVTDLVALADDSVRVLPEIAGESLDHCFVRVLHAARQGPPLSFWATDDKVFIAARHAVGDGYHVMRLLAAAVRTALDGELPASMTAPATQQALPRAVWAQFGRHPTNVVRVARAVAGDRPPKAAARTVDESDWYTSLTGRSRSSTAAARRELMAWRAQHAPGLSSIPLLIAAAELARRKHGVRTAGDPLVLFDGRRYVHPGGANVPGNFSVGLRVRVADSGNPAAINAVLRRHVALGRPLAVLGAAALLRPSAGPLTRADKGAWDMTYTHVGRAPHIAALPWLNPRAAFIGALLPTTGPSGVTVAFSEMGGRLHVSISFHSSVIDARVVERVLDDLCTEPAALLEQHQVAQDA